MKRLLTMAGAAVAVLAIILLAVFLGERRAGATAAGDHIPVARVRLGNFYSKIFTTAELRPTHSAPMAAPPIAGGALQIVHLLHTGTAVRKGGVVIEFDPSEQEYTLEQSRSELLQAEQEIAKANADAAVQAAQDKVALVKAKFEVRRAELEVGKNELVSSIDAKKNELALEQAKRALAQLEQDIQSHVASGHATTALAEEKGHKARLAMTLAQQNIEKMRVRSPIDGLVAIERNREAMEEMFFGQSIPDYREGDQCNPGTLIAQVVEPKEMELAGKISENDRSNLKIGQATEVRFDALPSLTFHGVVETVGSMAARTFWNDAPGGGFDITIQMNSVDPRLRAGLTAQVVIIGEERKNALYVPRQAVFVKDGKRVVYLKNGNGFELHEVKIQTETEGGAVIEGVKPGIEVALVNPEAPRKASSSDASNPTAGVRTQ